MGETLHTERRRAGSYLDFALTIIVVLVAGLGIGFLSEARSPNASSLDVKLALGCFAVVALSVLAARDKILVAGTGLWVLALSFVWFLLVARPLVTARSPIAHVAEVGLGAALLYWNPPALHKPYYGFVSGLMFFLHGMYRLICG